MNSYALEISYWRDRSKHGLLGPFRCFFCLQDVETTAHVFIGCIFTQKVWTHFLRGLPYFSVPLNSEPVNLFKIWQTMYPGILSTSFEWRKTWQAISKFFWWKIWLARNDSIFNNKFIKPKIVAIKAKALLLEVVGNVQIDAIKLEDEHKWLGSPLVDKIQLGTGRPVFKSSWKVRITEEEFPDWWQKEKKSCNLLRWSIKRKSWESWGKRSDFISRRKA